MALNEHLRDRILDDLSGQFAQDKLGMEEYEQRVKAVSSARDDVELIKVNADILPAHRYLDLTPNRAASADMVRQASSQVMVNYGEAPARDDAVAIFSGCDRRGEFLAAKKIEAVAIFGGTNIDLRRAAIPVDGMVIEVTSIFGGCTIILPEGVDAEIQGAGIFGGFNKPHARFSSGGPKIKINGAAIFGGVDIRIQAQPERY